MKKSYLLYSATLLTLVISIFATSCSKNKGQFVATNEVPLTKSVATDQRIGKWGSVTGMILPLQSKVKILLNGKNITPPDLYFNRDGSFRIDRIPAGIYTITIIDMSSDKEYIIPDIKISPAIVTDLGIIKLD